MDYVVGSVAALISGNVTPNRPKIVKRALTPMKHQQSPNVTPKSELVGDRSIFLSPTMQKKKAIVKKSPKRIFQNPDLDNDDDGNSSLLSPKADKVKKHLKDDLDDSSILSPKSPKNKSPSPKKKLNIADNIETSQDVRVDNENTPKKKKKKLSLNSESVNSDNIVNSENKEDINMEVAASEKSTPKKKKKSMEFVVETIDNTESQTTTEEQESNLEKGAKKSKKGKKSNKVPDSIQEESAAIDDNVSSSVNKENEGVTKKKKNKKRNKILPQNPNSESITSNTDSTNTESESKLETNESEYINPNAITNKDSDSEHESDDEIESENEETNKAVLDTGPEPSSDDEEEPDTKKGKAQKVVETKDHISMEEEVKRTLFVGNVPFSSKCKKEIKNIFSKYGDIETVRIRTVPVKDARVTPKLAVIKEELHPDRSTVNVYIKYKHPSSVNDALVENNTVLNEHHLRVSRSDVTGSEHDPRCSVFVGNIPFALEDEGLRAMFEKCGQIESVRIIRDRKTNAGKGFGYVNFTSKDGVELALALTEEDLTLKNRILRVKRCTQPTMNKQRRQQNDQRQHNPRQQNYQPRQYNQKQNYNQRGFNDRGFQMNRNQQGSDRFQRRGQNEDGKGEGAYRRIMNKRKPQDGNEGPPNKRQRNLNQPNREKKTRPEFVGMTAEKKKFQKRKLNKDQKKKKAFSEILTKGSQ
ncbi:uncharacterized protein [Epargyreus clarus]|uniref:uncharacterized protein n=1 Tax=Epargyreus clarus TaxID=520877 RepID=UPI003C2D2337